MKYFGFIQPGSCEFNLLLQLMGGWGGVNSVLKEKPTPSGRNVFQCGNTLGVVFRLSLKTDH